MGVLQGPVRVGSLELKNRLVMAPMATERSEAGMVTDRLIDHYAMRARGGHLGLVIVEHSFVTPEGKASKRQLSAAEDAVIPGLKKLADVIHGTGTPVILQISHAGSAFRPDLRGIELVGPSPVFNPHNTNAIRNGLPLPRELTAEEICRIRDCFVAAARRAARAGFDGVEIHSAHGYLLDVFYSPLTNRRSDAYSGFSLEGRTRLQAEILGSIRQEAGKDFMLSIRLGACDYTEGGAVIEEIPQACRILEEAGADMISISGGLCYYSRPGHKEPGWFAELSEKARGAVGIPVLLTGGIRDYAAASSLVREGKTDLIGLGRGLFQNRKLAARLMEEDART